MTIEEATRLWVAQENARAKVNGIKCALCGEDNLDFNACFNCSGAKECADCCGCETEAGL